MRSVMVSVACGALALGLCGNAAAPRGIADLRACYAAQAAVVPFSGVVLVRHGDDEFFTAAGLVDVGGAPISRATRFRLASVSKTFTTAVIGRLAMAGKVKLTDSVRTYVPELPEAYAAVTIDQLIHHRSGTPSLTMMTPESFAAIRGARRAHDLLPLILGQPLAFAPGARQEYSNGGFYLLGMVIESVTGSSYGDALDAQLFRPLGMTASGLSADAATALPMTRMGPPGQPPLETPRAMRGSVSVLGSPAGDAVSTADDMMRFGQALLGTDFLSDAVKVQLFPQAGEVWRLGQAGGAPGTNTDFTVLPGSGDVLVTLANLDPPAGELMGEVLRGVVLGKGCTVLRPEDRPSPLRIMGPPGGAQPPRQ